MLSESRPQPLPSASFPVRYSYNAIMNCDEGYCTELCFVRYTRCALLTPASGSAHLPEVQYTPVDMCLFCHITATATVTATAITAAIALPLRPFLLSLIFLLSHSVFH
jgi:hypothetical protein